MDELLRVLREEAATEASRLREEASREAARIVAEARSVSERLRAEALAREAEEAAARLRGARDVSVREQERALLVEGRRQLDRLRGEALERLPGAVSDADLERFVREVVLEAGPVEAILVVDPGAEAAARRVLEGIAGRGPITVREAPAPRGGVELVTGAMVLDDTVAGRLERAWPRLEPELARLLFSEG